MTKWTSTGGWPDHSNGLDLEESLTGISNNLCEECDGTGVSEDGEVCEYCGGTGSS
jgi:DnaJ-class molecular chaperone